MSLYGSAVKPIFFTLNPETSHHLALALFSIFQRNSRLLRALFGAPPVAVARDVAGIRFRNPVGLAAGMDKNAIALSSWEALGFGFVEIGTITALAQPGNPRPRLFRYPAQQALVNRMGFNNDGAAIIAKRLQSYRDAGRWPHIPIGINIGKSKVTPLEDAATDYLASYRVLLPFADYFVVNVSSPNTPGLRRLQDIDALGAIISALRAHDRSKPLFVKIAPDLSDEAVREFGEFANNADISGLIATNTTLDHSALPPSRDEQGGLSGHPLGHRAANVLRILIEKTAKPVIASGGIMDSASARERFDIGSALVQIYTGFVFRGPALIREICAAI